MSKVKKIKKCPAKDHQFIEWSWATNGLVGIECVICRKVDFINKDDGKGTEVEKEDR